MRNRIAQIDWNGQESLSTRLLLFHSKRFCQCQEKPRNEPLAVLQRESAVIIQVLLQVGERPFDFVVRVGHSLAVLPLVGEEVRQIEVQAVHRCSQSLMCIVHLPILVETLMADSVLPLLFPVLVISLEVYLVSLVKPAHQVLQLLTGMHLGIQRQIPPDDLLHVELAHLYVVF